MKPITILAVLGLVAASSAQLLAGLIRLEDDGQWKPALDNSALGSGAITWLGPDLDDGQWKPHLDNSAAGLIHRLKRSVLVNPNALNVPADTLNVALAKQAQLIQQNTEGTRNILGGGIPLNLPADTLEVAIGKQAHAIAHENQKAITNGIPIAARIASPLIAAPALAAPSLAVPAIAARVASPLIAAPALAAPSLAVPAISSPLIASPALATPGLAVPAIAASPLSLGHSAISPLGWGSLSGVRLI